MAKHGKNYQEAVKLLEKTALYGPEEAVAMAQKTATAKFDETIELHIRMGLDPRNATQQVRGTVLLPHGLGKTVKILVFAQGEAGMIAQNAGADYVGSDDLVKKIEGGWIDFDVSIATPDMMGKVGKLGKILGRRGLMPNPKTGTVVKADNIEQVINESRKGRVEFKLDRTAIIHLPIGKKSFETAKLVENLAEIMEAVEKAKPAGLKGQYIRSATLTSTMGPGIKLDLKQVASLEVD
jgi:large subunit ribosomal protein L1